LNFDFSDEQKALKEEARKFLTAKCPADRVRALNEEGSSGHDAELWSQIVEQGWTGAAIPEAHGGLGLGYLELCCIAEELGRSAAAVPFASSIYFFAEAVLLAGSKRQKEALLPGIVTGEVIGTMASSERAGPVTADSIEAEVRDGKLYGTKLPVADGSVATHAVVLAKEGGKPGLFIVSLAGDGITCEALRMIDQARNGAKIAFNGAPAERLGTAGEGITLFDAINDRAAVLLAFEQVGGSDRCLEMARDFAMERIAFGRPIAGYQAIKHRLADMYAGNTLARGNAYYGAWALNTNAAELPIAAAGARISASDAYWFAAKENVQVHGGMGFTWEVDCHLHYRRSQHLALVAGSTRIWKERLVSRLEMRNAA
jgi:alkylation response protein AidB-like acyl-CoA dehydrogenase